MFIAGVVMAAVVAESLGWSIFQNRNSPGVGILRHLHPDLGTRRRRTAGDINGPAGENPELCQADPVVDGARR